MTRLAASCVVVSLIIFVASCSSPQAPQDDGLFFPTVARSGEYPAGDIGGVLKVEDGCLVLDTPGGNYLLLWPEGYLYTAGSMEVSDDGRVEANVGESVTLGGGERPLGVAQSDVGRDIPVRCQVGRYWLVSP